MVPGMVVEEPPGSVEVDGEIVITVSDGVGCIVFVLGGIVVKEPFGKVSVVPGIVASDSDPAGELLLRVSVVASTVVSDPLGNVSVEAGMVITEDLVVAPDRVMLVPEIVVDNSFGRVLVMGGRVPEAGLWGFNGPEKVKV